MNSTPQSSLRATLPRSAQAELHLPAGRDPLAILEEQHESRLPDLIGVRVGRMLQSPFAYYRGTVAVMAADLAEAPVTGPTVVSCGDAHVSNFGFFASPERSLLFDLNDFDEAGLAPWEWDVKRLAASAFIGGQDNDFSDDEALAAAEAAVSGYRDSLRELVRLSATQRYYFRVESGDLEQRLSGKARAASQKATAKARSRTSDKVLRTATTTDADGRIRILDQPPVTRHVDHADLEDLERLYHDYLGTVREDVAFLLGQYRIVDFVLRIVGVGSVGTRCYVIALEGPTGDVLFLQAKEAQPSVLSTYGGVAAAVPGRESDDARPDGERVVAGQRILQAQSDPFLGHIIGYAGESAQRHRVDYYWRQFRDMKGSIEPSTLGPKQMRQYSELCGRLLARAHSQSPAAAEIADYLGGGAKAPEAFAQWAGRYAEVNAADFARLRQAVEDGRMPAEFGV